MKPSQALQFHRDAIRRVVLAHRAKNPRVFGSVLSGQDTETSDLDILIDTTPSTSLMDVAAIQVELENLLGITVDVLTPNALPDKFRNTVLAQAVSVWAEVIGEAANNIQRVDLVFAKKNAEIPWQVMYAMRNRLSHGYEKVDNEMVWNTAWRQLSWPPKNVAIKLLRQILCRATGFCDIIVSLSGTRVGS